MTGPAEGLHAQQHEPCPEGFARLHADARHQLVGLRPGDPQQAAIRDTMLAQLDAYPNAMWRGGPVDHFTGSCVVFDTTGEHVLLVLHSKARMWLQPGGHFERDDPSVLAAALREVREETGVDARAVPGALLLDHHELGSAFGRCHSHLDLRHVAVAELGDVAVSEESEDVAWWPLSSLPTDPRTSSQIAQAHELVRRAPTN